MCKKYIKTTLLFLCSLLLLTGCGNITTTSTTDQKAVSSQSDTQSSAKADNDTTDLKSNTAQPQKNDSDQTKDSNQTEKSSADQKSSSAQTQKNSPAKKSNATQSKKNSLSKKSASSHVANNSSTTKTSSKLLVHFIDVGQGDSILITQGKHAMLIDAGNNDKGTTVQLYLKKQGLTSLDYVIGTHPDADHIGGLDVVIYKFDCKKILLPDCTSNTATYRDVLSSMKSKNYTATHPAAGQKFSLGKAQFTITGPVQKYNSTNDNSLSLRLTFMQSSFLFTGDVTQNAEPDLIAKNKTLQADVLKIAHHGSKYSTTSAFLTAVSPKYAVISCAEGNSYGFPCARVLNLLRKNHVKTFRTDEQGSIVATSNGQTISWNTSPSTSWKAGESTKQHTTSNRQTKKSSSNTNTSKKIDKNASYVINTSTKKFHLPSCYSVKKMSVANTQSTKASRSELIKEGYSPCKNCNP